MTDVDGMSEDDGDHVGCSGEGCPNRCAFCGDCGHVEDGFVGCGGADHDVGGVVHGYIARIKKTTMESHTTKFTTRIQSLDS